MSTDLPLISVITPTWHRYGMLAAAVASVAAQHYPRIEHIVVSDGPDGKLRAVPWPPYVIYSELPAHAPDPHYGAAARNRGLELASGPLIAYLDDDDAYRPGHLLLLARALEAAPGAGFAYSRMDLGDQVLGSQFPAAGNIGTPMVLHRRKLAQIASWIDGPSEDWEMIRKWIDAGIRWVHLPVTTVTARPYPHD